MKRSIIIAIIVLTAAAAGFATVQALAGQPEAVKSPAAAEPAAVQYSGPFDPMHVVSDEPAEKRASEKPQEPSKTVETYQQPSETATAEPAPQKTEQGGHIPFTNKPVTAGDPESYIDTVGQCPFYEMAGEKGCVPPADIECNADWSDCKLKVEVKL